MTAAAPRDEEVVNAKAALDVLAATYDPLGRSTHFQVVRDFLIAYTPRAASEWGEARCEAAVREAVRLCNARYRTEDRHDIMLDDEVVANAMARALTRPAPAPSAPATVGDFYGPAVPLFRVGDRVRVKHDCRIAGRVSMMAGKVGTVSTVNPETPKSRYLIAFDDDAEWRDLWADRDLEPAPVPPAKCPECGPVYKCAEHVEPTPAKGEEGAGAFDKWWNGEAPPYTDIAQVDHLDRPYAYAKAGWDAALAQAQPHDAAAHDGKGEK